MNGSETKQRVGQAVLPASRPSVRLVFSTEESRLESRLAGKTAGPTGASI